MKKKIKNKKIENTGGNSFVKRVNQTRDEYTEITHTYSIATHGNIRVGMEEEKRAKFTSPVGGNGAPGKRQRALRESLKEPARALW